ncbi:MAG: hypothetical protein ABI200_00925 [Gaiellales bacterium]
MNLGALKSGAMLAGVTIGAGAVIGGGLGAVRSLKSEPDPTQAGFTQMEKRGALANVISGAAVGALGGVALIGAKKVVNLPALKQLSLPAMLGLGAATGAAAFGAHSVGRSIFN